MPQRALIVRSLKALILYSLAYTLWIETTIYHPE